MEISLKTFHSLRGKVQLEYTVHNIKFVPILFPEGSADPITNHMTDRNCDVRVVLLSCNVFFSSRTSYFHHTYKESCETINQSAEEKWSDQPKDKDGK